MKRVLIACLCFSVAACGQDNPEWRLALKHDQNGAVSAGSVDEVISAVRRGCAMRVAWGARRAADPTQTIEHISEPLWVSVRNGETVEVQIGDFLINLSVLGEPAAEHPRREQFGGVDRAVMWRANFKTDGTFDAVWYDAATGDFITRVPQRHSASWYVDCDASASSPLYPAE